MENNTAKSANTFPLKIEFFGIPRLRSGVAEFFIDLPLETSTLHSAIELLQSKLPKLVDACFDQFKLKQEFMLNISGRLFTRSLDHPLVPGDSVLILSSDVGG